MTEKKKQRERSEQKEKRKKKEERTLSDKKSEKLQRFFRKAILLSLIGHAPLIIGGLTEKEKTHWSQVGLINFNDGHANWAGKVKKELEKTKDITPEEAEKIIDNTDPEAVEGFEKARRAIEMRKAEREKRIDENKVREHKEKIRKKLEEGEKVSYEQFIFESEEIAMGIDPQVVENARKIFAQEMEQLEALKPQKPTREFLREVVSLSESKEKSGAYEPTRTSLSEYLDRKGKGLRGNCVARGKYMAMALEHLYPNHWKDVLQQKTGNHIRTLLKVDGATYMMEPGVRELTDEERKGTIFFHPDKTIEMYAGFKIDPIAVEGGPVKSEDKKEGLPVITDENKDAFPTPEAAGKLRDQDEDMSFLYKPKYTPPEVRDLNLPPIQEIEKKKDVPYNPDDLKKKKELDLAQFVVVEDESGEMKEVIPWEPEDYPDIELMGRVVGKTFYGDRIQRRNNMLNPSVKTIQKINSFAVETARYGSGEHFSQDAFEEIFKSPIKRTVFAFNHPYIPMSPMAAFTNSKSFKEYAGELELNINRDTERTPGKQFEKQGFEPEQFQALMDGKGGLALNYSQRKPFEEKEMKMIAGSSRPYILLKGYQCGINSEFLEHMQQAEKTTLLLHGNLYFPLVYQNPKLLLNKKVQPIGEYFDEKRYDILSDIETSLKNAYAARERIGKTQFKDEIGQEGINRLDQIIAKMEQLSGQNEDQLNKLKEEAITFVAAAGEADEPMGSLGAAICNIPETKEEAQKMGIQESIQITSPEGVTYSKKFNGEVVIPNGVRRQGEKTIIALPDGHSVEIQWDQENNPAIRVLNKDQIEERGKVQVFGPEDRIVLTLDGKQNYVDVIGNGLGRIKLADGSFINFKMKEKKTPEVSLKIEKQPSGELIISVPTHPRIERRYKVRVDFQGILKIKEGMGASEELLIHPGMKMVLMEEVTVYNGPDGKVIAIETAQRTFYVDMEKGTEKKNGF